jgi:hypothetical protein
MFSTLKKEDVRVERYQKLCIKTETKTFDYERFVEFPESKKRKNKANTNDDITVPPTL